MSDHVAPTRTFSAAAKVFGVLPQTAALLVGASAIAYFCGWAQAHAYFQSLGASWAVKLLTPMQILLNSIWVVGILVAVVLLSVRALAEGASKRSFVLATLALFVVSLVLSAIPAFYSDQLLAGATKMLSVLANVAIVGAAGTSIGELIAAVRDSRNKWRAEHLMMFYFIAFYGLWQAPANMGRSLANAELESPETQLPSVRLSGVGSNSDWRLIGPVGANLLLVRRDKIATTFRLVDSKDVYSIASEMPAGR